MLAILECCLGELKVCPHGRDDRDGVDVRRADQFTGVIRDEDARISFSGPIRGRLTLVTYGHQFATVDALKIAGDDRPPITEADYPDPNHRFSISYSRTWHTERCGL